MLAYGVEGHGDLAAVAGGRQTRLSTIPGGLGNHVLGRGDLAVAEAAASLVGIAGQVSRVLSSARRSGVVAAAISSAHEGSDRSVGLDWSGTLCAAQRTCFTGGDLALADDGRVGLGAAAVGGAVAGSAIGN